MAPVNVHRLSQPIILCCILVFMLLLANPNSVSAFDQRSYVTSSTFNLTLDPSSVVIKVGQNATVNLILANSGAAGEQLCFGQQGFPDSGFILTFLPQCTMLTPGFLRASLSVEATAGCSPSKLHRHHSSNNRKSNCASTTDRNSGAWYPSLGAVAYHRRFLSLVWVPRS